MARNPTSQHVGSTQSRDATFVNYDQLIGGTATATSNQRQVAWSQACAALDMENILILCDVQAAHTPYLALPGSAAANGRVMSPLACAFASHPAHKGYGIYLHQIVGGTAAVVHTPIRFEAIYNTVGAVQGWLSAPEQSQLPVFDVTGLAPWEFAPLRLRLTQDARDAMRSVAILSFWGAAASLMLAFISGIAVTVYHTTAGSENHVTSLKVTELASKEIGAYSSTLFELTRVSSLVVKTGGWIEKYSVKDGKTQFEALVPEWVTTDAVRALGPVVTEKDYVRKMVIVRRGGGSK